MWTEILNQILYNAVLFVLIPAIGSLFLAGIKFGLPFLVLKLADSKLAFVLKWIEKMVKAAEQKWSEPGSGEAKKDFVSTIVNKIVKLLKIDFTEEEVDALIEASVKEMNTTVKETVQATSEEIDKVKK